MIFLINLDAFTPLLNLNVFGSEVSPYMLVESSGNEFQFSTPFEK